MSAHELPTPASPQAGYLDQAVALGVFDMQQDNTAAHTALNRARSLAESIDASLNSALGHPEDPHPNAAMFAALLDRLEQQMGECARLDTRALEIVALVEDGVPADESTAVHNLFLLTDLSTRYRALSRQADVLTACLDGTF